MMIFDERVDRGFASAGTHGDDAEFASEWDEFFEDIGNFARGRRDGRMIGESDFAFATSSLVRRCHWPLPS